MTAEDVLAFWFEGDPNVFRKRWFEADPAFDAAIRERYGLMLKAAEDGALDAWRETAHGALALVIVLDQFGRNIHRDSYLAYSGDAHARHVARDAIARGFDAHLTPMQRSFLYLPFVHSEDAADQEQAVLLLDRMKDIPEVEGAIAAAQKYRDIIRRFGRFPHRNASSGASPRPKRSLSSPMRNIEVAVMTGRHRRSVIRCFVPFLLAACLALPTVAHAQRAILFNAADGRSVHALLYPASGAVRGVLLLFHQAEASKSEYAPIAPELARLGWTAIAIDQRSGGNLFGGRNETAAGRSAGFLDALPDLEGALAFARTTYPGQRVLAWGSSYSASLAFVLAAAHPDEIAGVLAFSPGEYLPHTSVRYAASQVHVPIFVTSAAEPGEIAQAKEIIDAAPAAVKVQFRPKHGTHGSGTLRSDTDPSGAAENWAAVRQFLDRFPPHTGR